MVRDPRAVAYSWSRHVERPEARDGDEMPRYSALGSSLWWMTNNGMSELLRPRGLPVTRIHYEQLVSDPLGTLRGLPPDLDLPVEPTLEPPERPGRCGWAASHSVAGNPMRFTTGVVALHQDDAWKSLDGPHRPNESSAPSRPRCASCTPDRSTTRDLAQRQCRHPDA